MSKKRIIILLGVLTAFLPLTGFPGSWRSFFTFVFGIAIASLAFVAYRNGEPGEPLEKKENSFTENTAPLATTNDPSIVVPADNDLFGVPNKTDEVTDLVQ